MATNLERRTADMLAAIGRANYTVLSEAGLSLLLRAAIRTLCDPNAGDDDVEIASTRKRKVEDEIMRRVDVECLAKYGHTAGQLAALGNIAEPAEPWVARMDAPEPGE